MPNNSSLTEIQNISKFNQFLNEIDLSYIKNEYLKHLEIELENGDSIIMRNDDILTDISKVTIKLSPEDREPLYWCNIHSARAIINVQKVTEDVLKRYEKFLKVVYKRAL
jgi:hypothetical protein